MSLSKSNNWYSNNDLHFSKGAVSFVKSGIDKTGIRKEVKLRINEIIYWWSSEQILNMRAAYNEWKLQWKQGL